MDLLSYFEMEHAGLARQRRLRPPDVAWTVSSSHRATHKCARGPPRSELPRLAALAHGPNEDVAVNLVITAGAQVFDDAWARRMNIARRDMGSGMTEDEVDELTVCADISAVRAYRSAVGRRTREVVRALRPEAWEEIVGETDIARAAPAIGPRDYPAGPEHPWCGTSRARRLSGAAVGHSWVHLGEAITISGLAGFGLGT